MKQDQGKARIWIRLSRIVSQSPPELFGRSIRHYPEEWIELRGTVCYPGEEMGFGIRQDEWSFWENRDIDLAPIFGEEDVERVYVEPGHPLTQKLRDAASGPAHFTVTVAEGPPATPAGSRNPNIERNR